MNSLNPNHVALARAIAFLLMGVFFLYMGFRYVGIAKAIFIGFGIIDIAYALRTGIIALKRIRS